jgi:hypothetical protein
MNTIKSGRGRNKLIAKWVQQKTFALHYAVLVYEILTSQRPLL